MLPNEELAVVKEDDNEGEGPVKKKFEIMGLDEFGTDRELT